MEEIKQEVTETTELQTEGQEKAYTQEEMTQLLQKEADRRVTSALEKQKREFEKKMSLISLDETQRATAEKDMRIQELQEQLREYATEKVRSELKSVLGNRGLSPQFADLIEISDNIEEAQAKIDTLDKLFKNAVSDEVKKRLSSGVPRSGTYLSSEEVTRDSFKRMSLQERNDLFLRDPNLFNRISQQ